MCRLMFKETKDSQKNLCKTAELLTITIELENSTNLPDSLVKDSYLFQPLIWKRISGTHGKGLLQLKPVYEMLSLSLLSYETEETSITLQSKPQGCVENLTELEYERIFRNFLLNFTKENDEICNEHIGEMSGYARFYHECCQYDQHGNMQCNRVLKNKWMQAIQYCTYIVIIIVVLYCPLMIPSSLYDSKYGPQQFVYCLKDSSQMFNYAVKKTCSKNECQGHNKQKDKLISYAKWKVELVIFLIKVAIYTMVGVILNSSHAMQYISIISLAWLYYRRCFGGIGQIYKDYNKAVHSILYRVNKRQLNNIATKESKEQENTAFQVIYDGAWQTISDEVGDKQGKTDTKHDAQVNNKQDKNNDSSQIQKDIDTSDRNLKFKTNSVILLLDDCDKQYITKTFFFEVCKIEPDGPGPMNKHFVRALRQFGIIILFLIFVTLVVLAFGDSYSMTFSNQLLATLAGGVVPLILMKTNILFAQAEKIDVNELVNRYFSDQDITNETILSNVQKLQKSLQEMKKGGVNENEKIDNKTTEQIVQVEENTHQLKNGEVIVKGVFKKNFNEQIGKDEKWWNIADIDMIEYDESNEMNEGTVDLNFCNDTANLSFTLNICSQPIREYY
ncbi:Hypothetical predicted protein [Mytilus galloprovincialis]|uniref:Uncharacterized protein n=1 Tax=Mytilus galloprovincialis TaxID=29158 RepID=A0A8B6GGM6_MYTGA|nr:Hypothetical predicted protein [Mytilus galloprovincialis]